MYSSFFKLYIHLFFTIASIGNNDVVQLLSKNKQKTALLYMF